MKAGRSVCDAAFRWIGPNRDERPRAAISRPDDPPPPYASEKDGARLIVRLTPRASRSEIVGIVTGADGRAALQVRLAAPPVDGAANKALIAFLAEALDLRKSDIVIRSGKTARLKVLHLAGDSAAIIARLDSWLGVVARDGPPRL